MKCENCKFKHIFFGLSACEKKSTIKKVFFIIYEIKECELFQEKIEKQNKLKKLFKNIYRITLFNFEINNCNGFTFELLGVETSIRNTALLGFHISNSFFYIYFFYSKAITIFEK